MRNVGYKLGRESVLQDSVPDDARFVGDCLSQLGSPPEEVLRRRLFYTLILAELHRRSDPVPFRQMAMQIGQELEDLRLPNPSPMFMSIIEATRDRHLLATSETSRLRLLNRSRTIRRTLMTFGLRSRLTWRSLLSNCPTVG